MALKLASGNYVKVVGYDYLRGFVHALIFSDAEQRQRCTNLPAPDGLSSFEQFMLTQAPIGDALNATADGEKSVKDNVLAACYAALKADPRFADATDC